MRGPGVGCIALLVVVAWGRPVSGAPGDAPAPGDPVSSVELALTPEERAPLERYLGVSAGTPYDPEAVRRSVELLFAAGGFEDVVVTARPEPGGWALVFRPLPAPRLERVRLEGDAVLSARAARKIARLVQREPLWPARLTRAARSLAAALQDAGWLEARVDARAERGPARADAVFRIAAGVRARVARVDVTGVGPVLAAMLRPLARPQVGQVYRREQGVRAAERMRRALVDLGRWRAAVERHETVDAEHGAVTLRFDVTPGPVTRVEFRGAHLPAALRGALVERLRDGGMSTDVVEEASERIESHLREFGHREATAAHHEEPRPGGIALVYDAQAGPPARVYRVRVTGADDVEPPLPPALATRLDEPLRDDLIEEDARGLRRALQERGYVDAAVESDVRAGGGVLPVTFHVRPGVRTLVAAVDVDSPHELPSEVTPPELRLRVGQPYRVADVAADVAALTGAWRNAGFLLAEVTPAAEFTGDKSEVRLRLGVHPGPRTLVGEVVLTGLEHTREEVVRRELTLEEGRPLGFAAWIESRRRVSALGLFQRVDLRELDPDASGRQNLLVSVDEARRTTVAYGVGYAERELLRGSLEVTRRNLFGLDRTLTVFGRASFRGGRALVSYREPYLLGRKQALFVTGFFEDEDRVSFDYKRGGGLVQSALALATHTSLIGRLQYQRTKLYNVDAPQSEIDRQFQSSTTAGPSVSLLFDTRDDPLDPHRGLFVGADAQLSTRLLGGDRFVKSFVQASGYTSLSPSLLLAFNTRLGLARTFGRGAPTGLPLADRFFAGGDYSLRGFETDRAGPLEPSEDGARRVPTGGNALLLGALELRFDASRFFSLALFGDAGNVFPLVSELSLRDLRYSAGVGLRYKSALGPLRVDWGYKLDRRPGESASHLHVTVGHAF